MCEEKVTRQSFFWHCPNCFEHMCVDCHAGIDDLAGKRRKVIRGRVDKVRDPDHWVFENLPWERHQDKMDAPEFIRSRNVTWAEQIRLHGDGKTRPGPQYAFADKRFRRGQ